MGQTHSLSSNLLRTGGNEHEQPMPEQQRKSTSRASRSPSRQRKASGDVESEKEQWFHGDCPPASKYKVPELESSFSDNEEYPSSDEYRRSVRRRTGTSPAVFRTIKKDEPKAVERKTKQTERTTLLQELQCLNFLMTDEKRAAMEQANSWCPQNHSPNICLLPEKPLTFLRRPVAQSTDAARSKRAYSEGIHIFEVTWPVTQRGTHPVVGACLSSLPLQGDGYVNLLGSDKSGWGWDLRRNLLFHNGTNVGSYPKMKPKLYNCPDVFRIILNLDQGTVAFEAGGEFLGVAFNNLKGVCLHAAVSAVWGSCEIRLRYVGGSNGQLLTLQQASRRVIREAITADDLSEKNVDKLPLPQMLKGYVLCKYA